MILPPLTAVVLFVAAIGAGFIDAVAGGGGLITVPALLWAGLPPQLALGTNKLQSSCGTSLAVWHYARAGLIEWRIVRVAVVTAFAASALGTWVVTLAHPRALRAVIPYLLLGIAAWLAFNPRVGSERRRARIAPLPFALGGGAILGFYDGFFGPGTGSFWTVACVALLGLELRGATGFAKAANLASNLASLLTFAVAGSLAWKIGAVMIAGQLLGARLGAGLVIARGARFIRPIFLVVVLALAIKLLLE